MIHARRHRYRSWDGRQATTLSAEQVLGALGERLLDGDIERELDRAMYQGIGDPAADDGGVTGLDQLRNQIRSERAGLQQQLQEQISDGALEQLTETLQENASEGLSEGLSETLRALASSPERIAQVLRDVGASQRENLQSEIEALGDGAGAALAAPLNQTLETLSHLLDLDELEHHLRTIRNVADVQNIDLALIACALSDEAASGADRLQRSIAEFQDSGYVRKQGSRATLSARALQKLGDEILQDAFRQLRSRTTGDHANERTGQRTESSSQSRAYQFGDPFELDLGRTVLQAVKRGSGTPVRLSVDDMLVFEREVSSRVATVLAIDLSRSMGERGYLLAAKRLALALSTLIQRRFPRDHLHILGFSHEAREVNMAELTELTWDRHELGTNVQDALRSSREMLNRYPGLQHNLILLTDGEPTAYRAASGEVRYSEPPSEEALARTYAEAARCQRAAVDLLVVLLAEDENTVKFVERLARTAGGTHVVCHPDHMAADSLLGYANKRAQFR